MNHCYYSKKDNDRIVENEWTQEYIDGWINDVKNDKYLYPPIRHYADSGLFIYY
jgi:hypothetical protein